MAKLDNIVGPGTVGIAQRISSERNEYSSGKELKYSGKSDSEKLAILQYHKLISCGHNQF